MGLLVPPRPISKELIEKRISEGAKTFEEIDPEFAEYLRLCHFSRMFGIIPILLDWLESQHC